MKNPYADLPSRNFWRSGFAEISNIEEADIYKKKWLLDKTMNIATAGSCFAQHIGRTLQKRNFKVMDMEPAPVGFPEIKKMEYNYSIYSARYGNIYTARQLLQLTKEALGILVFDDVAWVDYEGLFRDVFRPNIQPKGFMNEVDVLSSRASHLAKVKNMLETMDVFVFTFGLTEAWMDVEKNIIYPMAPGTICGSYELDKHEFKNFNHSEILEDFLEFKNLISQVNNNKSVKFLITVSPVPLTATASDNHVMVATTFSKSVLRSVAGELSINFDDIDYFPSYEIITNPWSNERLYTENLRNVTEKGVEKVMRIFAASHDESLDSSVIREAKSNEVDVINSESYIDEGVVCEEALLEAFNKN
jgi:hypothetical protein